MANLNLQPQGFFGVSKQEDQLNIAREVQVKKAYHSPILSQYGTVEELTLGNLTMSSDPGFGNNRMNAE